MIDDVDRHFLRRCVDLATAALDTGNRPFGSVLVDAERRPLFEDHNRAAGGDTTRHGEFSLCRWAAANLGPDERAAATVYTSTEHCPMCSAAHGWIGLGRVVYASSTTQLRGWLSDFGAPPWPVTPLPITDVVPGVEVDGPVDDLAEQVRELHRRYVGHRR